MRRLLRGVVKTAAMAATATVGDNSLFVVTYLMRLLRVFLFFALWRTLFAGREEVGGYTLAKTLTYTLISEVCHDLLNCRTWLETSFWDGSIATRFLRPMGVFVQFTAEWAGATVFHFCVFSVPLLLCAPLLGVSFLPQSVGAGGLFLVSLFLAVLVGLGLEFVFSGVAIALRIHPYIFNGVREAVGGLLSGAFLPLALLPFGLEKVFVWLPFASQASAPLSLFTGNAHVVRTLGLQLFWAVALGALAQWLWRINRERMVSYGG